MSERQTKHLLQFIFAWILVWLFVVFVMEESFVDFILRYRFYLLIVSISYFYYYSIEYEPDEKYVLIRNVLIYGNIYLFAHMFFRPLLNISHQLFVLLWLIFLGLWWTTKLKSRWKYLLQLLWWVFSFFILISGMLYFYPEEPDIDGFIKSRSTEMMVLWATNRVEKKDAYIQLTDFKGSNSFEIQPNLTKVLSEDIRISYPSIKKQRDEKVIIMTPEWDYFWIFPQSDVQLEFQWKDLKTLSKLNWRVWFLSWMFDSLAEYSWDVEDLTQEQQVRFDDIYGNYKSELVSYLKNQIDEGNIGLASNTVMYDINGVIVKFLARMFPVTFGKNLHNYNEFKKYFSLVDEWVELGRYSMMQESWWSIGSFVWSVKGGINVWKSNLYGLKKPTDLSERF